MMIEKVSIIIPLYNKAPYVRETLESVIAQTHQNFECLVVDNCSTDDSVLEAQSVTDPRIALLSYTNSQGPGATRNEGLKNSTGEWILFLDADDVITPEHLYELLRTAKANPGASLVAGNWVEGDAALGENMQEHSPPPVDQLKSQTIAHAPWAIHSAIIMKNTTPFWPEELDSVLGEDIVFWHCSIQANEVAYSGSRGAIYRTQTPECRTRINDIEKWYAGIDAAIKLNIEHTSSIDSEACEALVRAYEVLLDKATNARNTDLSVRAAASATEWLEQRLSFHSPLSKTLRLRSLLGIRNYYRLAKFLKSPTR